jgi:hypothetical protein
MQLADVLEHQGMPVHVSNIRREHVKAFIEHLLETRKPATASIRYRALQRLFRFLEEEGKIRIYALPAIHQQLEASRSDQAHE